MSETAPMDIAEDVLAPLSRPGRRYFALLAFLSAGTLWMLACWMYQVKMGMGVTGLNRSVGWATYITNFVFWVGIAHSGTLISAILHLVRSRWRVAVARSAEAMTVFAVMTAGLFPLIHLGRVWVMYFILPYPSERQLWPNFMSPLVWDVVAISTYLTVSSLFWFVGMLPDLAAARDRFRSPGRRDAVRAKVYGLLSLGWTGSGSQWRHHGRGYLFFAALATPLVVSVHSVVSWDFAMSLLPGWHTTIFAPYFVAGAIHSGLAMVLTLLIPLRRLLKLGRVITIEHFEAVAQTMLVTTMIVAFAYVIEPFMAWYSGDRVEQQFAAWRATGPLGWLYWLLWACNVAVPLLFLVRRFRRSIGALLAVSVFVNLGMWAERFVIIVGATSHDFLPHTWLGYAPTWVELSITGGAFCFFLLWFTLFTRVAPTVCISDVKEDRHEGPERYHELEPTGASVPPRAAGEAGVLAVYTEPTPLLEALARARQAGVERMETYSPVRLRQAEALLGRGVSPVRRWTLAGALAGCAGGFALAIGTGLVNNLVVGAKQAVSVIPYCVIAFEGTILLGTLATFAGLLFHARLARPPLAMPPGYDGRFSRDRYGLFAACSPARAQEVRQLLAPNAEGVHDVA
ncbi:MAG: DUF3341 domain-containing protein [Planctomycetota bacterium]|nr:DUF3341 domain-containing protein [Planctomycetota bacterium]